MEPMNREEAIQIHKEKRAPNAALDCKHCGLWRVKLMESLEEQWMCAKDYNHRFCEGKCSMYEEKPKSLRERFKWLFRREEKK